ncbi:hypothetical protein WISP_147284 [Willisornis vidua]|uniref:Reverse transcriptase domain-containing protein n=1 Tax=Willisornis vidua TaxID=1566151 RepID=A0ABQ9CKE8_9PASS|nr:hypothetical protein WISP_147284 [Willisornis vidua]
MVHGSHSQTKLGRGARSTRASQKIPENLDGNFMKQVLKEQTQKDALFDLLLTSRADFENQVEIGGCLGHSNHEVIVPVDDSILGPVLFNIFLNDLDTELEGILSTFAGDTKLGGGVDSLKGREALQRDLEKSEDWAMTHHGKFYKRKCWILHLGWDNPGCSYRLRNEMLKSSVIKRDLGVLVDDKLNLSQQCPGSQGQPTDSILGPVLFNIFLNDLDTELEGILSTFAGDTKLGGGVDSLKGREALQRDLEKSEDWAMTHHGKFYKRKCWILHLGWDNPGCSYRLRNEMLKSSVIKRDLGVLVDDKLNLSQQCPGSQGQPTVSWGASGTALPASRGRGLSFSALHWGSLILNIVCRFGHCNIGNILS